MQREPFDWYTVPDFKTLSPVNVFHKEQEKVCIKSHIKNYHCLARANYTHNASKAVLLISADDCFKLFINGKFICCGPAESYHDSYFYNEIDITPYIKSGENVIAVHLYYQGLINRVRQSSDNRFGVGASVNGSSLKWKYKECNAFSGEILGYDTAFSENFDSRLFDEKWCCQSYNDSDWSDMVKAKSDHTFILQPTKLLDYQTVKPLKKNNLYDFETEIVGMLKVTAKGKSGDKIKIRFGEELNDDLSVRYSLRVNCVYEEIWTLDDGICTFENFEYKGFRFVEIISENADVLSVFATACHYPFDDEMCVFKSNDKNLEAIFNLCKNTIKVSCQNSYIDCPTREKGQYLGDALIIANSQILLTKDRTLLRKAIDDFAKTSKICPGLMAVSGCSLMQEIADYSLLFGELLMLDYKYSNDKVFLKIYYETAKNVIKYFQK
ncbi:MAG: family 78 glycoside hydrolase catalytic domain, partial [Clostridiales bacterium]|nr:family 78 glycoside hydrolase catalytic domain [Clostridiales bacterium]